MEIDKLYEQLNTYILQNFTLFWTIIIGVFAIIGVVLYFLAQSLAEKGIKKYSLDYQTKLDECERRISYLENSLREISETLREDISHRAKVETGSYTGTGVYGIENPCSIIFSFAPKAVILSVEQPNTSSGLLLFPEPKVSRFVSIQDSQVNAHDMHCGCNGSTVNWYNSKSAASQFNTQEIKYYYVAIG